MTGYRPALVPGTQLSARQRREAVRRFNRHNDEPGVFLREHAFYIRPSGTLDPGYKHAEPVLLAV